MKLLLLAGLFCLASAHAGAPRRERTLLDHAAKAPSEKKARPEAPVAFDLKDYPPPSEKTLLPVLSELDADTFARRQNASERLKEFGVGLLNAPSFQKLVKEGSPAQQGVVRQLQADLLAQIRPLSVAELIHCLVTIAQQNERTSELKQIGDTFRNLTEQVPDSVRVIRMPAEDDKEIERYNAVFESLKEAVLKGVTEKGYTISEVKPLFESNVIAAGYWIKARSSTGRLYTLEIDSRQVMAYEEPGTGLFPGYKVDLNTKSCVPDRAVPASALLPKGLKPGVLENLRMEPMVVLNLQQGARPRINYQLHVKHASVPFQASTDKFKSVGEFLFEKFDPNSLNEAAVRKINLEDFVY